MNGNILELGPEKRPSKRHAETNLTFAQQVVKDFSGLDSLPGFVLVIFERRDKGGAVFSRLVNSGERFRSRFSISRRDLWKKYFAIAVNDSVLSYSFSHSVTLDDGSEEFYLTFQLTFRVADPRKVAETREHDPLRKLRDEIARVMTRNCAKRKAEMFRSRFRELERIVIDSESARLRTYASDLGFRIISIDLDKPPVPDYQRRSESSRRLELNSELDEGHRAQQVRRLRESQTDAIGQALSNVSAVINTPAELREGFEVAPEIARENNGNTQTYYPALPSSTDKRPYECDRPDGGIQTDRSSEAEKLASEPGPDDNQVDRSPLRDIWKSEAAVLVKLLDDAGADSAAIARLREELGAIEASVFSATSTSDAVVSDLPQDERDSAISRE